MMSDLYTIKDERTVYCRAAMKPMAVSGIR